MQYEAARVLRDAAGREQPETPQRFASYEKALEYIEGTPVSDDGVRPWIRDTHLRQGNFLVIGARHLWVPLTAIAENGGSHDQTH